MSEDHSNNSVPAKPADINEEWERLFEGLVQATSGNWSGPYISWKVLHCQLVEIRDRYAPISLEAVLDLVENQLYGFVEPPQVIDIAAKAFIDEVKRVLSIKDPCWWESRSRARARIAKEKQLAAELKAKEKSKRHYTFRELAANRNWGIKVNDDYVPKNDELMIGLLDSINGKLDALFLINGQVVEILRHMQEQTPEARRLKRKRAKLIGIRDRACDICEQKYSIDCLRDTNLLKSALHVIIVSHELDADPEKLPYDDLLRAIKLTKSKRKRMDAILDRSQPPVNGANGLHES